MTTKNAREKDLYFTSRWMELLSRLTEIKISDSDAGDDLFIQFVCFVRDFYVGKGQQPLAKIRDLPVFQRKDTKVISRRATRQLLERRGIYFEEGFGAQTVMASESDSRGECDVRTGPHFWGMSGRGVLELGTIIQRSPSAHPDDKPMWKEVELKQVAATRAGELREATGLSYLQLIARLCSVHERFLHAESVRHIENMYNLDILKVLSKRVACFLPRDME